MHSKRSWRAVGLAGLVSVVLHGFALAEEAAGPYQVGRGIADITGPPTGVKFLGYVRPDQIGEGIHLRQWSRAFVVVDPTAGRRLALVTTDLQSITHALVLSVLDKLRSALGDVYHVDNTVIAATHTHAVPAGYWQYAADTPLGSPFYPEHYDALVEGIAASIIAAHRDLKPGRIRIAEGDVEGAGAQRSRTAYMQNPEPERRGYRSDIDTQMTLLRFDAAGHPVGEMNWYAVHPTSMSCNNRLISGDNKGYAAYAMERALGTTQYPFVAAFAQANCGDVTPNLNLNQTGPGKDEFDSTRIIGDRQFRAAQRLFESATEEICGPLDYRQSYVDLGHVLVRDEFTGRGSQTTSPSAYGYSFAAGSVEDGGGQPLFREGMTEQSPLLDGIAKTILPLPPPSDAMRLAHKPKPILLASGAANPPAQAQILPLGVARIGQLALVIGPAEFTTMSGRRFRAAIKRVMPDIKYVVIAGYANEYAGYVATREEYQVQHYEGAATLYGPWTQAAYEQEFSRLAADLVADRPSETLAPPPEMRGTVRPTALATRYDLSPPGAKFGDVVQDAEPTYRRGDRVTASFWTGNPANGYRADRRYAVVEQLSDGHWRTVAADGQWDIKCRWTLPAPTACCRVRRGSVQGRQNIVAIIIPAQDKRLAAHLFTIQWEIPAEAQPGTYRIKYFGGYKAETDRQLVSFEASTRTFVVE